MSAASLAFSGAPAPWRRHRSDDGGGSRIAGERSSGRATCVVVRARVSGGPETEESRWIPPPPFPGETRAETGAKVRPGARPTARLLGTRRHHPRGPELELIPATDLAPDRPSSPDLPLITQSWGKTLKLALAGVAITGASLVMPRRAHALPDAVVNGGYAAAGATAASYILKQVVGGRTSSTTASSAAVLAPATDGSAGTIADAIAAEGIAGGVVGAKPGSVGIMIEDAADSAVHAGDEASRAATGIAAGLEHAGTTTSPVIKTVQTEVVKTIRVPRKNLTRSDLVNLIIRETPAWQIGLAAAVPCAALLAVVVAARRFTHLEIAKARNELLTDHEQELAEQLEKTEEKLAAMIKTHASVSKEKESLEKKTAQMETKMNQKAMLEIEKLEAKFMMREAEQAREVEEAREALAAVVKEKEELARKIESRAKSEADAAIAEVEARLRAEADVADKAAAEKLEAAQTAAKAELEAAEKALKAELEQAEKAAAAKLEMVQRDLDALRSDDIKKLEDAYRAKAEALEKDKSTADEELARAKAELETALKTAESELEAAQTALKAELASVKSELASAEKAAEEMLESADKALESADEAALEKLEEARRALKAELKQAEKAAAAKLETVQRDLDAARSEDIQKLEDAYQAKAETLEKYKATADEELAKAKADLDSALDEALNREKSKAIADEELAKAKADLDSALDEASNLEKSKATADEELARAKADLENALDETSNLEKSKATADEELARAKADLDSALDEASNLEKSKATADEELARAKADLENALDETSTLRAELVDAKTSAETVAETMMKEADELRAKYEGELADATAAKAELEQWRADREEWETITKDNFLAMERELKETKSKLEATETEAAAAADESDVEAMRKIEAIRGELETEVAIASDRLQAMEATMRAAQQARADAEKELSDVRQDMDTLRQMMDDTSRESVQQNLDMEQELSRVVNEASELRAKLEAQAAQLALADADAAKKLEKATGETAALRAEIEASKMAQSAESATFSASKAELEEAMRRAHAIAKENAIKMVKHNERMGRWKSYKSGDIDIPVKFEIAVETLPGQRVAMVGTWNDWDIGKAFPMVWTEGNVWTVTTPIHGDDTYEYKYVVIDGEGPEALENAKWQTGNNRALGLNLSLHDEVALVEVVDTWRPDPKQAPIILHMVDGTLKEEGSTKLLHDVIRELRTEQALLDGSLNVKVLAEIATAISAAAGPAIADPLDEEFFDAMEKAAVEEATPAKPPKDAFKVSTESNIVDVSSESIEELVPVFVDAPNAFENTPATPVNVNVTADGEAIAEATMADVDVGEGQDATSSSKTGPR